MAGSLHAPDVHAAQQTHSLLIAFRFRMPFRCPLLCCPGRICVAMASVRSAKKATSRVGRRPRTMTSAHKAALARGREMSTIVDRYLSVVNTPKKRGRKVTVATLRQRLATAEATLQSSPGVAKVLAAQEVRDLRARLADNNGHDTTKALEASFVKVARQFGVNRGISYAAWRDAGVPAEVLKRAGITRTRG